MGKYFGLKLDMRKAFDRIQWILKYMLKNIGFSENFCRMIMDCIKIVSFSILVNGMPTQLFKPTWRLRQGDPRSPYLLIICAKGLTSMNRRVERQSLWNGIRMGSQVPMLNHLFFADNNTLQKFF